MVSGFFYESVRLLRDNCWDVANALVRGFYEGAADAMRQLLGSREPCCDGSYAAISPTMIQDSIFKRDLWQENDAWGSWAKDTAAKYPDKHATIR